MGNADSSVGQLSPTRFEAVLASISDGVFTMDLQGRITCFNRAAAVITGFTREEAIGSSCSSIFRSDICPEACALRYTMETGEPVDLFAVNGACEGCRPVEDLVEGGRFRWSFEAALGADRPIADPDLFLDEALAFEPKVRLETRRQPVAGCG